MSHSSGQSSQKNRIMPVARRGIDKNAVLSSRNRRRTLGGHMSGGIKSHKNFASIMHSSFFPKGVPDIVHLASRSRSIVRTRTGNITFSRAQNFQPDKSGPFQIWVG